jgi:hypothetical protein
MTMPRIHRSGTGTGMQPQLNSVTTPMLPPPAAQPPQQVRSVSSRSSSTRVGAENRVTASASAFVASRPRMHPRGPQDDLPDVAFRLPYLMLARVLS